MQARLAREDRLARLRIAGELDRRRATPGLGGGDLRHVVELDVDGPPETLEERGDRPQLAAVQADRRLRHVGHDVGEALDHVGARVEQRLDQVRPRPWCRASGSPARAPTPARSGPRPARPMPWHVVHCPFSRKIFSPAATSCAGVTLPPSSDSSSGGFDSIWGIEFAYQLKLPMTARANTLTLTVTGTAIGRAMPPGFRRRWAPARGGLRGLPPPRGPSRRARRARR